MKPSRLLLAFLSLAFGSAHAVTSERSPDGGLFFSVLPGSEHLGAAAELGFVDQARVSLWAGSESELGARVVAPWFEVFQGSRQIERRDPLQTDRVLPLEEHRDLRLATALSASLLGLGSERRDVALGASFGHRTQTVVGIPGESDRSWLDLSAALRWEAWRVRASVHEALVLQGSGLDPRLGFGLGRALETGLAVGAELVAPLESGGLWGLQLGGEKILREAVVFRGQLGTQYGKSLGLDSTAGAVFQRQALTLALGTGLRFRPWRPSVDPLWVKALVQPFGEAPISAWLYDFELGVQVEMDAISGQARSQLMVSRTF